MYALRRFVVDTLSVSFGSLRGKSRNRTCDGMVCARDSSLVQLCSLFRSKWIDPSNAVIIALAATVSPRETTSNTPFHQVLLRRGRGTNPATPYVETGKGIVQRARRACEVLPQTSKSASFRPCSSVTLAKYTFAST